MGLSDIQVRKIKPREKRFELTDGQGLTLLVLPSGTKSWVLRYQFHGKARRLTIGQYPALSLAEARNKATETRNDIQRNIDPAQKKEEETHARINTPTFIDIINELWAKELSKKKSGKETRRLLEHDIVPKWGKREVHSVKRRDIVLLLDEIEKRAPITRNRVQGALSRLFNFAAERGVIDDSPCTRIKKVQEQARKRILTEKEIVTLWHALDLDNKAVDAYKLTKLALKILLLTGQRPGEVTGMMWSEIDGKWWNIPAERMKSKEPHRVPLTPTAIEHIELARQLSGQSPYVFLSPKKNAAILRSTMARTLSRNWEEIGIGEECYTPHDIRRTVRSKMAAIGVSDVIAERVMAHKLQGIMAVYNQHNYDVEKKLALEQWEQKLLQIIKN